MKRMIKLTAFCFGIIAFVACGGNSVKGSNGKSYDNYIEACADNEYEAARQLLEKEGYGHDNSEFFEIFEKESSYLAGLNEEQSTTRLLYLIKEEKTATIGKYNIQQNFLQPHLSKLMSLGVAVNNVDLVRGIYKQCDDSDIELNPGKDVIEYMAKQNTDEDNQLVIMHDKMRYDKKWLKSDEAMNHIDIALRVNNIELAKGLVDILNPEDKTIAAKKLKVAK
jgi:hypothetical protein